MRRQRLRLARGHRRVVGCQQPDLGRVGLKGGGRKVHPGAGGAAGGPGVSPVLGLRGGVSRCRSVLRPTTWLGSAPTELNKKRATRTYRGTFWTLKAPTLLGRPRILPWRIGPRQGTGGLRGPSGRGGRFSSRRRGLGLTRSHAYPVWAPQGDRACQWALALVGLPVASPSRQSTGP